MQRDTLEIPGYQPTVDPRAEFTKLGDEEEQKFQRWYSVWSKALSINPNPDSTRFDYRKAYRDQAYPVRDPSGYHWQGEFSAFDEDMELKVPEKQYKGSFLGEGFWNFWTFNKKQIEAFKILDQLTLAYFSGKAIPAGAEEYYKKQRVAGVKPGVIGQSILGAAQSASGNLAFTPTSFIYPTTIEQMPVGPVETFARHAGHFVGFVGGAPLKIAKWEAEKLFVKYGETALFKKLALKVGKKGTQILKEGSILALASMVGANENLKLLIEDHDFDKFSDEIQLRAESALWGFAYGTKFATARTVGWNYGTRLLGNVIGTQLLMSIEYGGNPVKDLNAFAFNTLLDIWYSTHKLRPAPEEIAELHDLSQKIVNELNDKESFREWIRIFKDKVAANKEKPPQAIAEFEKIARSFEENPNSPDVAKKLMIEFFIRNESSPDRIEAADTMFDVWTKATGKQQYMWARHFLRQLTGKNKAPEDINSMIEAVRDQMDPQPVPKEEIKKQVKKMTTEERDRYTKRLWQNVKTKQTQKDNLYKALKDNPDATGEDWQNYHRIRDLLERDLEHLMVVTGKNWEYLPEGVRDHYVEYGTKTNLSTIISDVRDEYYKSSAVQLFNSDGSFIIFSKSTGQGDVGVQVSQFNADKTVSSKPGSHRFYSNIEAAMEDQVKLLNKVKGIIKRIESKGEWVPTGELTRSTQEERQYWEKITELQSDKESLELIRGYLDQLQKDPFFKPSDNLIEIGSDYFWMPEYALRKIPSARKLSTWVSMSESALHHEVNHLDGLAFRRIYGEIPKPRRVNIQEVRPAVTEIEIYRELSRRMAKEKLSPEARKLMKDIEGKLDTPIYRAANSIYSWFSGINRKSQSHVKKMVRLRLGDYHGDLFDQMINASYDPKNLPEHLPKSTREKSYRRILDTVDKKTKKGLLNAIDQYLNIDSWTFDNYVGKYEEGHWRVYDSETKELVAVGTSRVKVMDKVNKLKELKLLKGPTTTPSKEYIDIEGNRIHRDPFEPFPDRLKGEDDVMKSLRAFSWSIRKKFYLEPLEVEMEKEFKLNPDIYTDKVKKMIRDQFLSIRGKVSLQDKVVDDILEAMSYGGEPFMASRFVGRARQVEGILKLAYRIAGGFVNSVGGHSHTIVKVGFGKWAEAFRFVRAPENKSLMDAEEKYMGVTLGEWEANLPGATKNLLHPLWIFSRPERSIRRISWAANYLAAKEMGMDGEAAKMDAHYGMRTQAFVYNTSALPRWMRTPLGKAVGQFKAYLVQEIQFLQGISGAQWARYLGLMMLTGGPQAALHVANSIPWLNMLGAIDKINEWLLNQTPNKIAESTAKLFGAPDTLKLDIPVVGDKRVAFGVPGLLGLETSQAMAVQLPMRTEDWLGPAMADLVRFASQINDATKIGFSNEFGITEAKKEGSWFTKVSPFTERLGEYMVQMRYMNQLLAHYYEFKPNGEVWVRDPVTSVPIYPMTAPWDYVKLMLGAPPIQKSIIQTRTRIVRKEIEHRKFRARAFMAREFRHFFKTGKMSPTFAEEFVAYGLTDPDAFKNIITNRSLTPGQRDLWINNQIDKLTVWDKMQEEIFLEVAEEFGK